MKRFLSILIAALMLCSVACITKVTTTTPDEPPIPDDDPQQANEPEGNETPGGGWQIIGDGSDALPEKAATAFSAVTAELDGANYEPIAYLGSQVVAGMNYAVLCRKTLAVAEPKPELAVMKIYVDLEDKASILAIEDFDIGAYAAKKDGGAAEQLVGGWTPAQDSPALNAMPQDAATAFSAGLEGFVGNKLTPIAYLGKQLVSGMNYAFLCRSELVTAEPVVSIQVVVIYQDLQGNTSITNIATVDLGNINH